MELYFNQTDINKLKKYERHFYTVTEGHYKYSTTSQENNEVADIYENTTKQKLQRNWSCSKCVYTVFEKAAILYFKSLKKLIEEQHGERKKEEEPYKEESNPKPTNKKATSGRGRKKRTKMGDS